MLRGTKTRLDIENTSKLDLQRLMRIKARNFSRNTELHKMSFQIAMISKEIAVVLSE